MATTVKEGHLIKQGGKFKTWHKRYFRLESSAELLYFKAAGDYYPQGKIPLRSAEVTLDSSTKKYLLKIRLPGGRTYSIQSATENDIKDWHAAIDRLLNSGGAPEAVATTSKAVTMANESTIGSGTKDAINRMLAEGLAQFPGQLEKNIGAPKPVTLKLTHRDFTILVRHAFYGDSAVCVYDLATDHIQVAVTKDEPGVTPVFTISSARYPRPLKISSKLRDPFLATLDAFVSRATSGQRRATLAIQGVAAHTESDLIVIRVQGDDNSGPINMGNIYNVPINPAVPTLIFLDKNQKAGRPATLLNYTNHRNRCSEVFSNKNTIFRDFQKFSPDPRRKLRSGQLWLLEHVIKSDASLPDELDGTTVDSSGKTLTSRTPSSAEPDPSPTQAPGSPAPGKGAFSEEDNKAFDDVERKLEEKLKEANEEVEVMRQSLRYGSPLPNLPPRWATAQDLIKFCQPRIVKLTASMKSQEKLEEAIGIARTIHTAKRFMEDMEALVPPPPKKLIENLDNNADQLAKLKEVIAITTSNVLSHLAEIEAKLSAQSDPNLRRIEKNLDQIKTILLPLYPPEASELQPSSAPMATGGPPPPPGMPGFGGPPLPPPIPGGPGAPPPMPGLPGGRPKWKYTGPKPGTPMKKVNWTKVPEHKIPDHSFWTKVVLQSPYLDYEELELHFGKAVIENKLKERMAKKAAEDAVRLLDSKRSANVEITLNKLDMDYSDIRNALLELDEEVLTAEYLEMVRAIIPTDDECKLIKEYKGSVMQLGIAEQFYTFLVDIPNLRERVDSFIYALGFEEKFSTLQQNVLTMTFACEDIQASRNLNELFRMILCIGNFCNDGTNLGDAKAFKLSSLLKLADTRDNVTKDATLLHYIAYSCNKHPHLLDFLDDLAVCASDLTKCPGEAAKVAENIPEDLAALKLGMVNLKKVIGLKSNIENDFFAKKMSLFYSRANGEVDSIDAQVSDYRNIYESLVGYFGEDKQLYKPAEFFKVLDQFKLQFEEAVSDPLANF